MTIKAAKKNTHVCDDPEGFDESTWVIFECERGKCRAIVVGELATW